MPRPLEAWNRGRLGCKPPLSPKSGRDKDANDDRTVLLLTLPCSTGKMVRDAILPELRRRLRHRTRRLLSSRLPALV